MENIASMLDISHQDIAGLEKSPKADLKVIVATLKTAHENKEDGLRIQIMEAL